MHNYRSHFPFFENNPGVIYLDSAATTQKPNAVIRTIHDYLKSGVANPERGSYKLAQKIEADVEHVREITAQFIGESDSQSIIFTSGTTAGLNLLAQGLGYRFSSGDEILVHASDHEACVAPWEQTNAKILYYETDLHTGLINNESILSQISDATKVVIVTHSHNIFGVINDIATLKKMLPKGCLLIVDAAQSAGHTSIDVSAIDADAVVFSGHKLFSLEGVGVLWISERMRNILRPVHFGGGKSVFEPGTRNTTGILSLGAALQFIEDVGIQNIEHHVQELSHYAIERLSILPEVEFLPGIAFNKTQVCTGIISFNLTNRRATDVAEQLNERGICIRAGLHCSFEKSPLYDSLRISFHIYNTKEDIDVLVDALSTL